MHPDFPGSGKHRVIYCTKVGHAGTKYENGKFYTNGGRVLGVTATADTLDEALEKAYAAVEKISFEGAHYRHDIGKTK